MLERSCGSGTGAVHCILIKVGREGAKEKKEQSSKSFKIASSARVIIIKESGTVTGRESGAGAKCKSTEYFDSPWLYVMRDLP